MLGELLKDKIDEYHSVALQKNPLFRMAEDGTLTRHHLARFVNTAKYLVSFTPKHMQLAKRRAMEMNRPDLVAFFDQKMHEEDGHDAWAAEDYEKLTEGAIKKSDDAPIAPSVVEFVSFLEKTIDSDPVLYLPYILLAEYYTSLMGPKWLSDIQTHCAIPAEHVSIVGKHAELDKLHVIDDMAELNRMTDSERYQEPFLGVLRSALLFYDRIYSEIA